jgi:hypothetical protein
LPALPKPAARQPRIFTVEAGSPVKVRTTTILSTKSAKAGDAFVAHLEVPLMAGESTLAPKGARVDGVVAESDPGGRVKGRAEISVRLTKLHLENGQTLDLATGAIARAARATKTQDAAKVGIGSGVGAAIGAIAGGGRGAAIGAAAGAGAGGGVVLATRGAAAEIPPETVLTFKLTSPVSVQR